MDWVRFRKLDQQTVNGFSIPEAEFHRLTAIAEAAREKLSQNQKQCEELQKELDSKEKSNQESIDRERQELADVEKKLEICQAELNVTDEAVLTEEVAALTERFKSNRKLLKEWDDDDDSSIYSDAMESEAETVTPTKIPEVDFGSFFKNPNDFPDLKLPSAKQAAAKISPIATSTGSKLGAKPELLVSPKKKASPSFASVLKNASKPSKEKFREHMRNKRSPVTHVKVSSPASGEPRKKLARSSTPMHPKPAEPEDQKIKEVEQPAPEEVALKPRALNFDLGDGTEAGPEKNLEQPMATDDNPQLSQSSTEREEEEGGEDDAQMSCDEESEALMENTAVMPKAVAVENGQVSRCYSPPAVS